MGASHPEQSAALRSILPKALFLVPGYGAQGGTAQDAVRGFVPGPAGLEGGIVSSSRGVLYPPGAEGADPAAWEKALDAAVEEAIATLGEAIR